MKLKDTFMSSPICVKIFEISMYLKKFPFALQTIFSLHNLEPDNFFQPTTVCEQFFCEEGNLLTKNNGLSLSLQFSRLSLLSSSSKLINIFVTPFHLSILIMLSWTFSSIITFLPMDKFSSLSVNTPYGSCTSSLDSITFKGFLIQY